MIEHLEKELNRYVIATFDIPTNYLIVKGGLNYSFIDNIQVATKFVKKSEAEMICATCSNKYKLDLVVLPLNIKYTLLEEGD